MEKLYKQSFPKLIPLKFTLLRGYNWQHEENMYVESASSLSEASSTESPAPMNATNCTINGTAGTLASNGTCIATASGGFWSGVGVCNLSQLSLFYSSHSLQVSFLPSYPCSNLLGSRLLLAKIQKKTND